MTQIERLESLIPEYAQNKAIADKYKKLCDAGNAQIKAIMEDLALPNHAAGGYRVTRSVQEHSSMNEEMLIDVFTKHTIYDENGIKIPIIKMKPYIDFDALESALYHGVVPDEVTQALEAAKETKYVTQLRVAKVQGENA